jgi:hypothetical protein
MEKKVKLFWRYFGSILVLVEIFTYVLLIRNPFPWQFVRLVFMLANAFIIAYLVQVKLKVEKHNAQINSAYGPNNSKKTIQVIRKLIPHSVSRSGRAKSSSQF